MDSCCRKRSHVERDAWFLRLREFNARRRRIQHLRLPLSLKHLPLCVRSVTIAFMDEVNPYAAPEHEGAVEAHGKTGSNAWGEGDGVWCNGELLVVHKQAMLPDRCVKCNRPAHGGRLKCRLLDLHPSFALFVAAGAPIYILIYVAWALIKKRAASIEVGLCEIHRRKRRNSMFLSAICMSLGVGMFVMAFISRDVMGAPIIFCEMIFIGGVVALVVGCFSAATVVQTVESERIDAEYVWLKKVDPSFLAELPDF